MPQGICRATLDTAGGIILGGVLNVLVNGKPCSVQGDLVVTHGETPHDAATMIALSNNCFAGGKAIVIASNLATCGHVATGSTDVLVGN